MPLTRRFTLNFLHSKSAVALLGALLAVPVGWAQASAADEAFARDLVALARQTPSDFSPIRGVVTGRYTDAVSYAPTGSFPGLRTTALSLVRHNDGTRTEFRANYADASSMAAAQASFLAAGKIFADPRHPEYQGFTGDTELAKSTTGGSVGFVYRNGVVVAAFQTAPSGSDATLYVGLLFSEDLAGDLAKMFPPPRPEEEPARHWGSELADGLMDLRRHAATDFAGMLGPVEIKDGDDVTYRSVPLLGADKAAYYDSPRLGLALVLTYNKTNPAAKRVEREAKALFSSLARQGGYSEEAFESSGHVDGGNNEIFHYWTDTDRNDADYFTIRIGSRSLVDESAYAGKFPTEVTASRGPQVREIRGKGQTPDSYLRENGRFVDGKLVNGTRRYHGYGSFFDGVWSSSEWVRPPGASYDVLFHPAGSPDTIYGHFNDHGDMSLFVPDLRYHDEARHQLKSDVPKWLVVALAAHDRETENARIAAASVNASTSSRARDSDEDDGYRSSSGRPAPPERVHKTIEQRCIPCGGSGWVTTMDSGGRHREPCRECNGSGKISVTY